MILTIYLSINLLTRLTYFIKIIVFTKITFQQTDSRLTTSLLFGEKFNNVWLFGRLGFYNNAVRWTVFNAIERDTVAWSAPIGSRLERRNATIGPRSERNRAREMHGSVKIALCTRYEPLLPLNFIMQGAVRCKTSKLRENERNVGTDVGLSIASMTERVWRKVSKCILSATSTHSSSKCNLDKRNFVIWRKTQCFIAELRS